MLHSTGGKNTLSKVTEQLEKSKEALQLNIESIKAGLHGVILSAFKDLSSHPDLSFYLSFIAHSLLKI
jgi:hypothetical protein